MATQVVMEALSPTMEEGRLVEWKKREGDPVAAGEVLADVETDKAVMELVARAGGVLLKQVVAAGATVPVSAVVGWIGAAGESVDGAAAATAS
ncbi:MAG: iron ABC transporter ATP-binding protein, partial [Gemmatimonadetes bacterium]|nr:iron ABC transporter ATP-binding protein [Gemmatimonadota bacterium]